MSHTLTIAGLDDFEAEHISQILNDYRAKMLESKVLAMVEDHKERVSHRVEWIDEHLEWHESIMSKVKWEKKDF